MRNRWTRCLSIGTATAALVVGLIGLSETPVQTQGQASAIPRTAWDKKPNLNGIWQVLSTANWDLEAHEGGPSPVPTMGVWGARAPGLSVVVGGTIPYKPEALAKREQNRKNAITGKYGRDPNTDPELNCFLPGVPRATYLPHPFQIFQSPGRLWMVYQYSYARREIFMNGKKEPQVDSWMGTANARWDGDTLVIVTTGLDGRSWFDRAGNYHTDALRVTERYSMIDRDHIMYEATMEDPNVFTRPWTIRMPLYRRIEENVQLLQFRCVEYVEEFHYKELVEE